MPQKKPCVIDRDRMKKAKLFLGLHFGTSFKDLAYQN
jgi:hypothetical protein